MNTFTTVITSPLSVTSLQNTSGKRSVVHEIGSHNIRLLLVCCKVDEMSLLVPLPVLKILFIFRNLARPKPFQKNTKGGELCCLNPWQTFSAPGDTHTINFERNLKLL